MNYPAVPQVSKEAVGLLERHFYRLDARSRAQQTLPQHWRYLLLIMGSDVPVTETQTDTEMIDISKTHTETNTEKIFNTDSIYT